LSRRGQDAIVRYLQYETYDCRQAI